jgi:hypothetical protein
MNYHQPVFCHLFFWSFRGACFDHFHIPGWKPKSRTRLSRLCYSGFFSLTVEAICLLLELWGDLFSGTFVDSFIRLCFKGAIEAFKKGVARLFFIGAPLSGARKTTKTTTNGI